MAWRQWPRLPYAACIRRSLRPQPGRLWNKQSCGLFQKEQREKELSSPLASEQCGHLPGLSVSCSTGRAQGALIRHSMWPWPPCRDLSFQPHVYTANSNHQGRPGLWTHRPWTSAWGCGSGGDRHRVTASPLPCTGWSCCWGDMVAVICEVTGGIQWALHWALPFLEAAACSGRGTHR